MPLDNLDINCNGLKVDIFNLHQGDVDKLYIREDVSKNGTVHIKVSSTEWPNLMTIKHWVVSLFTNYRYLRGEDAIKWINNDIEILDFLKGYPIQTKKTHVAAMDMPKFNPQPEPAKSIPDYEKRLNEIQEKGKQEFIEKLRKTKQDNEQKIKQLQDSVNLEPDESIRNNKQLLLEKMKLTCDAGIQTMIKIAKAQGINVEGFE